MLVGYSHRVCKYVLSDGTLFPSSMHINMYRYYTVRVCPFCCRTFDLSTFVLIVCRFNLMIIISQSIFYVYFLSVIENMLWLFCILKLFLPCSRLNRQGRGLFHLTDRLSHRSIIITTLFSGTVVISRMLWIGTIGLFCINECLIERYFCSCFTYQSWVPRGTCLLTDKQYNTLLHSWSLKKT